jgi:hypothetical protein
VFEFFFLVTSVQTKIQNTAGFGIAEYRINQVILYMYGKGKDGEGLNM